MRTRRSVLQHPCGQSIETPLLVPSFSSRGFDIVPTSRDARGLVSEASQYLEFFGGGLDRTFLVSAYDLHHKLFRDARAIRTKFDESVFAGPRVLFVDSGLYEARHDSDAGDPIQEMRVPYEWSRDLFKSTADDIAQQAENIALISWDLYEPFDSQISAAQEFLSDYRERCLRVILLKPERRGGVYRLERLTPEATLLRAFDIVGVTEKELGGSVIERAATVARLRDLLDVSEVAAPIHIFGALDPLYVPLYYAAGAEVFDGLTWLRYAWMDGLALHRDSWPMLAGLNDKDKLNRVLSAQRNNLDEIERLTRMLKRFAEEGDWALFGEPRAQALQDAYLGLESEL